VTIKRLPSYFRVLDELTKEDVEIVSSTEMGRRTGFSSEQIRKDLAYFGAFGTRGVGYNVSVLRRRIRSILGLDRTLPVALVGAGNLGRALAHYNRNQQQHMRITHIFDINEEIIDRPVAGIQVQDAREMGRIVADTGIKMAIVAVPREAAQKTVDLLAQSGVKAVLNFAPVRVDAPEEVVVKSVDLTSEMQSLAYYCR